MKIIKQGILPGEKTLQTECKNRHTIFEFKMTEAKQCSSPKNETYIQVKCPYCHQYCYIDT